MMPVAEFAGRRGWGYDGVNLYAPSHLYGTPDDLRRFIDRAHRLGLGVILDVVYNHFGPDGNYLSRYSPRYFSTRHTTEWGQAINFDDDAAAVREFVTANAAYWIEEFHLDGLRLDATQQIYDTSEPYWPRSPARARRRLDVICLFAENGRRTRGSPLARTGRIRIRCAVERRLSPRRRGRADRPARGLLPGLPRNGAGVSVDSKVGLSLPRPAVLVAAQTARHAHSRSGRAPICDVSGKPRSGR